MTEAPDSFHYQVPYGSYYLSAAHIVALNSRPSSLLDGSRGTILQKIISSAK